MKIKIDCFQFQKKKKKNEREREREREKKKINGDRERDREREMRSCALPLRLALVASVLLIASVPQRWRLVDAFATRHGHAARTHGDGNGWMEDEVHALPGWDAPLPSRWFAGFTSAGKDQQNGKLYDMHAHYIFIESEGSPEKDPIIIWTNGGPGAASYFG